MTEHKTGMDYHVWDEAVGWVITPFLNIKKGDVVRWNYDKPNQKVAKVMGWLPNDIFNRDEEVVTSDEATSEYDQLLHYEEIPE